MGAEEIEKLEPFAPSADTIRANSTRSISAFLTPPPGFNDAGKRLLLDPNGAETTKLGELSLSVTSVADRRQFQDVVSINCEAKLTPEEFEEAVETCAEGCRAVSKFLRRKLLDYMTKVATISSH